MKHLLALALAVLYTSPAVAVVITDGRGSSSGQSLSVSGLVGDGVTLGGSGFAVFGTGEPLHPGQAFSFFTASSGSDFSATFTINGQPFHGGCAAPQVGPCDGEAAVRFEVGVAPPALAPAPGGETSTVDTVFTFSGNVIGYPRGHGSQLVFLTGHGAATVHFAAQTCANGDPCWQRRDTDYLFFDSQAPEPRRL
jgi:hypothetical protein